MTMRSGVKQQGHGDHGALAHPPAQLVGIALQMHGVDPDQAKHFGRAFVDAAGDRSRALAWCP